ncbi:helix-turn-helix domain-containing protein [Metabacillus sediminilitoris]|uniref:Helicase Helix-turn-helix domain-containing protein n=1 Tax=Metabacillus sediminilitoris TaxID=2567941 RepID=A0A4S4C4Y4_9BACI|nr:helix-turn-helix domain-containing protein [Metabacillus sediminilitoris]QGQ46728.1 hypothetical protein GMB29_16745 [Metabacillus sediminilitoris]THF82878.1 hypothetical protein E6W99_00495 [Metabacillus sediminilitoris]
MKNSYFHVILLHCINQLNGERSVSAIYHLLNGKKSSQTIQDGKLFNLTQMFSLFPKLSRHQINDACKHILQEELIVQLPNQHYHLTEKGKLFLDKKRSERPIPVALNGWKYGDVSRIFWRRISLLVQVLSNYAYDNQHYLPLTKNQEDLLWVKLFLKQVPFSKSELIHLLYKELKQVLLLQSNRDATIFIQRLTSRNKIGQTFEQIALKQNEDPIYTYLLFWNVIHFIMERQYLKENEDFVLHEIIIDKLTKNPLTSSTSMTRSYLLQGKSISEIAHMRRLKENTIEDHIVEITLHDRSYQPDHFLSSDDYERINHAISTLKTHQLKRVKEYLEHKYSYFQIRLAFALNGRKG